MAASQLTYIFWILKGWYLQNEKVLQAHILTGLYWDYICSIGNVNWHIKILAKRWLCAFNLKLGQVKAITSFLIPQTKYISAGLMHCLHLVMLYFHYCSFPWLGLLCIQNHQFSPIFGYGHGHRFNTGKKPFVNAHVITSNIQYVGWGAVAEWLRRWIPDSKVTGLSSIIHQYWGDLSMLITSGYC